MLSPQPPSSFVLPASVAGIKCDPASEPQSGPPPRSSSPSAPSAATSSSQPHLLSPLDAVSGSQAASESREQANGLPPTAASASIQVPIHAPPAILPVSQSSYDNRSPTRTSPASSPPTATPGRELLNGGSTSPNGSNNQAKAVSPTPSQQQQQQQQLLPAVAVALQPKRLHVSNIPFRFRDPDLRQLFGVSVCL